MRFINLENGDVCLKYLYLFRSFLEQPVVCVLFLGACAVEANKATATSHILINPPNYFESQNLFSISK